MMKRLKLSGLDRILRTVIQMEDLEKYFHVVVAVQLYYFSQVLKF